MLLWLFRLKVGPPPHLADDMHVEGVIDPIEFQAQVVRAGFEDEFVEGCMQVNFVTLDKP